jgi:hypothetical protein
MDDEQEREGLIEMRAPCGKKEHRVDVPEFLMVWAKQGVAYHAMTAVCGCDDLAYIVALQKDGARARAWASLDVVAAVYRGIPWIEEEWIDKQGRRWGAKRAPSHEALLTYFKGFATPRPPSASLLDRLFRRT